MTVTFKLKAEWLGDAYVKSRRQSILGTGNSSCKSVFKGSRKARALRIGHEPNMFDKQWESKWAGKKGEKSGIKGQKGEQALDHVGDGFYSEDGGEPLMVSSQEWCD